MGLESEAPQSQFDAFYIIWRLSKLFHFPGASRNLAERVHSEAPIGIAPIDCSLELSQTCAASSSAGMPDGTCNSTTSNTHSISIVDDNSISDERMLAGQRGERADIPWSTLILRI